MWFWLLRPHKGCMTSRIDGITHPHTHTHATSCASLQAELYAAGHVAAHFWELCFDILRGEWQGHSDQTNCGIFAYFLLWRVEDIFATQGPSFMRTSSAHGKNQGPFLSCFQYALAILRTEIQSKILQLSWEAESRAFFFRLHKNLPNSWEKTNSRTMCFSCELAVLHTKIQSTTITTQTRNPDFVHSVPLLVICYVLYRILCVQYLDRKRIRWRWGYRSFCHASGSVQTKKHHLPLYISFKVSYRR